MFHKLYQKHYFSKAQTKALSAFEPIGDPFGGPAYGEYRDPVTATVVALAEVGGAEVVGAAIADTIAADAIAGTVLGDAVAAGVADAAAGVITDAAAGSLIADAGTAAMVDAGLIDAGTAATEGLLQDVAANTGLNIPAESVVGSEAEAAAANTAADDIAAQQAAGNATSTSTGTPLSDFPNLPNIPNIPNIPGAGGTPVVTPSGGLGTGLSDLGVPTGGEMVTQGGLTPATVGQGGTLDVGSVAANQSEVAQSGLMGGATLPGGGLVPATTTDIAGSAAAGNAATGGGGGFSLADLIPKTPLQQAAALQSAGSALGGLATANAAKSAAQIQANAATTAAQNQAAMFNTLNAQQAPYRGAGYNALNQIQSMLPGEYVAYDTLGNPVGKTTGSGYLTQQFTPELFQQNIDPGYAFRLQQGQMANQRMGNVSGGGLGGNVMRGLQDYTQGQASQEYQNAFNRFQTQRGNIYNTLAGIAGIGQTGQTQTNQMGTNLANAQAQLGVGSAAAQAAGQVGQASALSNAANAIGSNFFLASLLGQNPNLGS
jgi:hypothetical protein